jgi:carboxypeptidase D
LYITPKDVATLNKHGLRYTLVPNEARLQHEREQKKRSDGKFAAYHNYAALTSFVADIETRYPAIAKKFTLGKSKDGRELWGIRLTTSSTDRKPEFKYIGNMHGDETVGREMLIRLIDYMCSKFGTAGDEGARITRLINSTDIYLIPSMNPDGFEAAKRGNSAGIDLNRNFPDLRFSGRQTGAVQPETLAVMNFVNSHHFVLSANFHGGAVVANYPYDGNQAYQSGVIEASPDDAMFQKMALTYSLNHKIMYKSNEFHNGITNGAEWYVLYGGMQDWNYESNSCMEITIELSDWKYPPADKLPSYWEENHESLLAFIELVHTGMKGTVKDAAGNPLAAVIEVEGINHPYKTIPLSGTYYRLLAPGTYTVTASSAGYKKASKQVTISAKQRPYEAVIVDFVLESA